MKKKQKAEPEKHRKSSYQGNSRNNSKSGGLTFSEKKRLMELKHILSGKGKEKEKPTTAQKTITFEKMFRDGICQVSHHYYTKMVEFLILTIRFWKWMSRRTYWHSTVSSSIILIHL